MKRKAGSNTAISKRARKLFDEVAARNAAAQAAREATSDAASTAANADGDSTEDGTPDVNDIHGASPTFVPDPDMVKMLEDILYYLSADGKSNIFITGPAGTGKTWLIKSIAQGLIRLNVNMAVIAPTGSAALNVNGETCDAFFGLTPNIKRTPLSQVVTLGKVHGLAQKFRELQVLIIDEVSMVSHAFMEQMNGILKEARDDHHAFGGVKLVAVGDFAQLPPVKPQEFCHLQGMERLVRPRRKDVLFCRKCSEDENDQIRQQAEVHPSTMWAFTAPVWRQLHFRNILLYKILRQKGAEFAEISKTIWLGNQLSATQVQLLGSQSDVVGTTISLFCKRVDADNCNNERSKEMTELERVFTAVDSHIRSRDHVEDAQHWMSRFDPGVAFFTMHKDHKYSELVALRKGMPVMLLANIDKDEGLVNGLQGIVVDWALIGTEDIPRIPDAKANSGFSWNAKAGRVSSEYVPSISSAHWSRNQACVRHFINDERNEGQPWPVVRFSNGVRRIIFADCCATEYSYDGHVSTFMRTQIPLMPCWGITMHKSQGLTLHKYVAELKGAWCPGLEYVALTRATSLENVEIRGLGRKLKFSTPVEVRKFVKDCFSDLASKMID